MRVWVRNFRVKVRDLGVTVRVTARVGVRIWVRIMARVSILRVRVRVLQFWVFRVFWVRVRVLGVWFSFRVWNIVFRVRDFRATVKVFKVRVFRVRALELG